MSQYGVKRIANYSGLAFGQGSQTFSTSPLWSPNGAYNIPADPYGAIQLGAIHTNPQHMGAIQLGAVHLGNADQSEESLMDKLKGWWDQLSAQQVMGYSLPMVAGVGLGVYYLFFSKAKPAMKLLKNPKRRRKMRRNPRRALRMKRARTMRLRRNDWTGDSDGHQGAAYLARSMDQRTSPEKKKALRALGIDTLAKFHIGKPSAKITGKKVEKFKNTLEKAIAVLKTPAKATTKAKAPAKSRKAKTNPRRRRMLRRRF